MTGPSNPDRAMPGARRVKRCIIIILALCHLVLVFGIGSPTFKRFSTVVLFVDPKVAWDGVGPLQHGLGWMWWTFSVVHSD